MHAEFVRLKESHSSRHLQHTWGPGSHLAAMLALHQVGELHEGEGVLLGGGCLGAGSQGHCVREGAPGAAEAVPHNVKAADSIPVRCWNASCQMSPS